MMETVEQFKSIPIGEVIILKTPISTEYRSQWSEWEAVREFVQNPLDETESLPELSETEDGWVCLSDNGAGCEVTNMIILGKSEKNGANKRGQYGEGSKMGAVVLLKAGYNVKCQSRDWIIEYKLGKLFDETVMEYHITKTNGDMKGFKTMIKGIDYKVVKKYLTERFVSNISTDVLHSDSTYGKLLTGKYIGKMYVKNIYVCDAPKKSEFGYDLTSVSTGTDRNFMNSWDMNRNIGRLLSTVKDKETIKRIIELQQKDILESEASGWNLSTEYSEVFKEMFPLCTVVDTDNELKGKVNYNGGHQVTFTNSYFVSALQEKGYKSGALYLKERAQEKLAVTKKGMDSLGKDKQRVVKRGLNFIKMLRNGEGRMFVIDVDEMLSTGKLQFYDEVDNTLGYAQGGNIFIATSQLRDIATFCNVMIEELIHSQYGVSDISEGFENLQKIAMSELIKLLLNYISPKSLDVELE